MLGEDIEDDRGSVNYLDLDRVFKCTPLAGCELGVGNNSVCAFCADDGGKFFYFSASEIRRWVGVGLALQQPVKHLRSSGLTQRRKLLQGIFRIGLLPTRVNPDDHNLFESNLTVFNLGDVFEFG